MPVTAEQEIVLLYALHACGGRPSKSRATQFIMRNHVMQEHEGDYDTVATDESRIENRIAWTRQNLRQKGQLAMPERGTWQITASGTERLKHAAIASLGWQDEIFRDLLAWERFSPELLSRLQEFGRKLKQTSTTS